MDSLIIYSSHDYGRKIKLFTLWQGPKKVVKKIEDFLISCKFKRAVIFISKVHARHVQKI